MSIDPTGSNIPESIQEESIWQPWRVSNNFLTITYQDQRLGIRVTGLIIPSEKVEILYRIIFLNHEIVELVCWIVIKFPPSRGETKDFESSQKTQ